MVGRLGVVHRVGDIKLAGLAIEVGRELLEGLIQIGRPSAGVDYVVGGREGIDAQEAAAALAEVLIVRQAGGNHMRAVGVLPVVLAVVMAAEHQEDVVIVLHVVVDGVAARVLPARGGQNIVADDHRPPVGILLEDTIRPGVYLRVVNELVVEVDIHEDEVEAAGADEVEVVSVIRAEVPAIPGPINEVVHPEVVVVERGAAIAIVVVVVAGDRAVGDAIRQSSQGRVIQAVERVGGAEPLVGPGVAVVHDVSRPTT